MRRKNNFLEWNRGYKIFISIMILLIAILLVMIFNQHQQFNNEQNKLNSIITNENKISDKIATKQKELNAVQARNALKSKNPKIRLSANQIVADEKVNQTTKKLFPILINFSSSKEYNARKEKATPYLDKDVLRNPELFGSNNVDHTGYVTSSGLTCSFYDQATSIGTVSDDGNTVPVTVLVEYIARNKGKRKGKSIDIYSGTYNIVNEKFEKLNRLSNVDFSLVAK